MRRDPLKDPSWTDLTTDQEPAWPNWLVAGLLCVGVCAFAALVWW